MQFERYVKTRRSLKSVPALCLMFMMVQWISGCAVHEQSRMSPDFTTQAVSGSSAEDHLAASQAYKEQAQMLNDHILALETRIETYRSKRYLDPKGFKRDSLQRLVGAYRTKASQLERLYIRHQEQAALPDEDHSRQKKNDRTTS